MYPFEYALFTTSPYFFSVTSPVVFGCMRRYKEDTSRTRQKENIRLLHTVYVYCPYTYKIFNYFTSKLSSMPTHSLSF